MKANIDFCGDSQFGPAVSSVCRGGFDFTTLFENSILRVLPAACFVLCVPIRVWQLWTKPRKVKHSTFYFSKLVVAVTLAAVQLLSLILEASHPDPRIRFVAIPAAVLHLVAASLIVGLTHLEHLKSVRPSFLLSFYLFLTVLLDAVVIRTAWLTPGNNAISACLSVSIAIKVLLLALETVEKRSWLLDHKGKVSSERTSGPFNRVLFVWLLSLLKAGYTTLLDPTTLPPIFENLASQELAERLECAWESCNHTRKYALCLAVTRYLRWEIVVVILPRLCLVALNIAQPFMISATVTFIENSNVTSLSYGYGLIAAYAFVFVGTAIATSTYEHLGYRAMAMLRGGMVSIIYQKMMALPLSHESDAMSLMGSDVDALAEYFHGTICDTWADALQLGLATWLLSVQIGAICIAPTIVAIIFTSVSFYMGKFVSLRQRTWLDATQKRIDFTTETLASIRQVKMLGLTDLMTSLIEELRVSELDISKKFRRIQTLKASLVNLPLIIGQFVTFGVYAIAAKYQGTTSFSVKQAITALALINLLVIPLRNLLYAIPDTYASIGCLQRIQKFLLQEPRKERRLLDAQSSLSHAPNLPHGQAVDTHHYNDDMAMSLKNVELQCTHPQLYGDNLISLDVEQAPAGSLVIIVGPVGCGKSSLLKALLGEVPLHTGEIYVKYIDIAICEQNPWIINASIRENIMAESEVDEIWYSTVIQACALDTDLNLLPHGDSTVVGEQGMKISGGQKQRIAIARAVYSRKRIALFDDPFGGLDNTTEQMVFERIFGQDGLLRKLGCTTIVAAHNLNHVSGADIIIVLDRNGQLLQQGTPSDLRLAEIHLQSLDLTAPPWNPEERLPMGNTEILEVPENSETTDARNRQEVDSSVYKYYALALGWTKMSILAFLLSMEAGFGALRYIWLTLWAGSSDSVSTSRLGFWLGIYASIGILEAVGLILGIGWTWIFIIPMTSQKLHAALLKAIMKAPISFLSNIETGILVNRFSQDMRLVDMVLPRGFITTGFMAFGTVAQATVAVVTVPYIAATLPLLIILLVAIQRIYLRTSRQLRLLEIETKAPLYSHFINSLSGLLTIRSFGWNSRYIHKTFDLLDTAQKPYYLLLCIQRWLILVLNLVVAGVSILLVGLAVALRHKIRPELLGVALVLMVSLGEMLADFIKSWTSLETSLGAIARIKSFEEDTPDELGDYREWGEPGDQWPAEGRIEFRSVSVRHSEASNVVLDNVSLSIQPRQKVGICGRTGSGKSSLILSLLRMTEISCGQILIDDQDIATLSPSLVRQKISCVTQDPFIFTGSVRLNADPAQQRSDIEVIAALVKVGLWEVIRALAIPEINPLEVTMTSTMLSHGQRQLFCLARALLKKSTILLLDEPTSSLDDQTDARMQEVIRSGFDHCTILMITHRLKSLLDFDRVAVIDKGKLVEFDKPDTLLGREDSTFAGLYGGESITQEI